MTWLLIATLILVTVMALAGAIGFALIVARREKTAIADDQELELRRAERRIYEVAQHTFGAMLEEARTHDSREVK